MSNARAIPKPPVGRLNRHGTIGAHIAPARTVAHAGKYEGVIFAFIVDT